MKRYLVVLAAAGALATAAATPALADTAPNEHNCEGAVVSSQTPGVVSDPSFPAGVTAEAHKPSSDTPGGSRDDFVRSFNDMFVNVANCPIP
jgi:hypothetical protein